MRLIDIDNLPIDTISHSIGKVSAPYVQDLLEKQPVIEALPVNIIARKIYDITDSLPCRFIGTCPFPDSCPYNNDGLEAQVEDKKSIIKCWEHVIMNWKVGVDYEICSVE